MTDRMVNAVRQYFSSGRELHPDRKCVYRIPAAFVIPTYFGLYYKYFFIISLTAKNVNLKEMHKLTFSYCKIRKNSI